MHLLLLLVGAVLAAAGAAIMRYGMPVDDVPSATLFCSGMMGIVGGLIIGALGVVARILVRIRERLEIQPLPVPPIAAVGHEDPSPRAVKAPISPSSGAARQSLLGWLTRSGVTAPLLPPRAPPVATLHEPGATPSVDLAPLTRVQERPVAPAAPVVRAPEPVAPPPAPAPTPPSQSPYRPIPKPAATPTSANTVYRSGVIDGMAYTLFMDGSIEAELAHGTVKFASVDELQKYLLGNR
jgi:hypothetical protein